MNTETFFGHLRVTINNEVKISSLKTLNYDLKSVILMYENSECVLIKNIKKATDFAFSVSSLKFLVPNYPPASKNEQQVESPNLLASLCQNTTDEYENAPFLPQQILLSSSSQ